MIIQVEPVIDYSVRNLCSNEYYNHPNGCPNFDKKQRGCPSHPDTKLFDKYFNLSYPIYAIYNIFDLKSHVENMRIKQPTWSEHQLYCVLYWQTKARKQLHKYIDEFLQEHPGYEVDDLEKPRPEAMGVNITKTMKNVGIILEWMPRNIAYQIALAGIKRSE